jgi:hypothetical protein
MAVHCSGSPVITLVVVAYPFLGCSQSHTSPPLQFRLATVTFESHIFVTISTRLLESHCALLQLEWLNTGMRDRVLKEQANIANVPPPGKVVKFSLCAVLIRRYGLKVINTAVPTVHRPGENSFQAYDKCACVRYVATDGLLVSVYSNCIAPLLYGVQHSPAPHQKLPLGGRTVP